ncbi:MAG: glycosyltransferase family 2 protein [Oscillospiraceae bacterium]|nr:glycosyltransferase family 2 protein [Oscillospiraceae bacterium]
MGNENKNSTAAVVVTYNRKELLLKCLNCLANQKENFCDIIIVDNSSSDGTEEAVGALPNVVENSRIIYFNTGANLGGAGGFNYGIRKGAELGYEYLWIMDDDCMARENTLAEFFNVDKKLNDDYGFLSSVVLWKDDSICAMNQQKTTFFKKYTDFDSELTEVIFATFVSLFLPVRVVLEVGLPIKEFFIWTDDWEYTRRISKKFRCYAVGKSMVTHESASNTGVSIAKDNNRLERYKYLYRNEIYLYRSEGIRGFFYEMLRLTKHITSVLLKSKGNKFLKCKIIIGSTMKGFGFKPNIEYVQRPESRKA